MEFSLRILLRARLQRAMSSGEDMLRRVFKPPLAAGADDANMTKPQHPVPWFLADRCAYGPFLFSFAWRRVSLRSGHSRPAALLLPSLLGPVWPKVLLPSPGTPASGSEYLLLECSTRGVIECLD